MVNLSMDVNGIYLWVRYTEMTVKCVLIAWQTAVVKLCEHPRRVSLFPGQAGLYQRFGSHVCPSAARVGDFILNKANPVPPRLKRG
jgi:hypothetical protein